MSKLFSGKTVLITGASSGFGEAFAKAFAREGARLINVARRKERLMQLEKELRSDYSVDVLSIDVDVADMEAVKKCLSNLPKKFAEPDILINNAGMVKGMNKVWETSEKDWHEMIDINVKGVLNVISEIVPRMIERNSGHIINIGSVSGHDTYPGGGVYCATKFAIKAITDTLRKELVASPIRVSMISPGMAKTEFSLVRYSGDQVKADAIYKDIEYLTAEDIAEIAIFMASRPPHVTIADVVVFPTNQASVSLLHRKT